MTHPNLRDNMWFNPGETGSDNNGHDKATNGEDDDNDGYVDDVNGFDFFWEDGSVYDGQPTDDPSTPDINEAEIDSHGTHVTGTVGAIGGNGVGVVGVNWRVKMISGKFLGPVSGSTDKAVKAIDYFIMLKRTKGLNIVAINASWGGGGYSRALHNALKRAAEANILFVAAAGNGDDLGNPINIDQRPYYPASYDTTKPTNPAGPGQPQEPGASYDNVIAVAAINSLGGIAGFSNFGRVNVDLGAPGVSILSTFPRDGYEFLNGTSMATPHVAGAVALYASTHPPQTEARAIKQAILDAARATPTTSLNNSQESLRGLPVPTAKNLPSNHLIAGPESKSRGRAMKRTASLLLITLVSCFSATAQTAKTRHPALPSDIAAMAGQDSDSLLKNPVVKAHMKKLLGKRYDSFMESFETLNPVTREGAFLFSSGCLLHACTHLESAIAIDLVNRTIHAAIFRQDEKTRYFNEDGRATPGVIRAWANNLRQINKRTNSSESNGSFTAPVVAGAQVETSPPRLLRNPATVRGFIGGESHDGYVIHARKGRTLTVRLSWQREGDNRASFSVSESPDYYTAEPVKFGKMSDNGKLWVGRILRSGNYYIDVVAHPAAHYTLKVKVK